MLLRQQRFVISEIMHVYNVRVFTCTYLSLVPLDFSSPEQISWSWHSCLPRHSPHCQYSPASCDLSFPCHPSQGRMSGCFHFHDCLCSGRKQISVFSRTTDQGLWQDRKNYWQRKVPDIPVRIRPNTDRRRRHRVLFDRISSKIHRSIVAVVDSNHCTGSKCKHAIVSRVCSKLLASTKG